MAIASLIIQSTTDLLNKVVADLSQLPEITVHSTTLKQEIIIMIEGSSLNQVSRIAEQIQALEGVIGVFPTYITTEDEETSES